MSKKRFNPSFALNPQQTIELASLWNSAKESLEPERYLLIRLKLARKTPVLTKRQLYACAVNLVNHGETELPEWLHEMLEIKDEVYAH